MAYESYSPVNVSVPTANTLANSTVTFINASKLKFDSLESEAYRTYEFPSGARVVIENPLWLNVSKSGGHRVFDAQGVSHYIPSGWIHLTWVVKPGKPHFDF